MNFLFFLRFFIFIIVILLSKLIRVSKCDLWFWVPLANITVNLQLPLRWFVGFKKINIIGTWNQRPGFLWLITWIAYINRITLVGFQLHKFSAFCWTIFRAFCSIGVIIWFLHKLTQAYELFIRESFTRWLLHHCLVRIFIVF